MLLIRQMALKRRQYWAVLQMRIILQSVSLIVLILHGKTDNISDSTEAAAVDVWHAISTFYRSLPEFNGNIKSKTFHLATQSYGGHYGPVFFNYIRKQVEALAPDEVVLEIGSLLVIDGIIDYSTQVSAYPRFARNNTHGVELNDTLATYMETSLHMPLLGCLDQLGYCVSDEMLSGDTSLLADLDCNTAVSLCRYSVELIYALRSPDQDIYDIRNHSLHPQPLGAYPPWLNTAEIQRALGVDLNYTGPTSIGAYAGFQFTGDWVSSRPLRDLSELLESGTRVALMNGDADYICNWLGGQDVSLTVNFTGSGNFRNAGYVPLLAGGKRYGDTREADNFSFTRLFDAGHDAPFYQPKAALALFNRTIHGWDIATGTEAVHAGFATVGDKESTYSQKNGDGPD
jgi:carboxypeptidase C (cathepsin A)